MGIGDYPCVILALPVDSFGSTVGVNTSPRSAILIWLLQRRTSFSLSCFIAGES